ncbi:MAG: phage portal protein [Clostridia bacterium]|nr:phage portal protein [Clostridia bacterium]
MNIYSVCEYLGKKLGTSISCDFYHNIRLWRDWYKGYSKEFHHYTDFNGKETVELDRYSLKMAKKVCEDWANLLFNEKTVVSSTNEKADTILKKVFGQSSFRLGMNNLVERSFALGTGAVVLRLNGGEVSFDFVGADSIIPISFKDGEIEEVAFASDFYHRGKRYTYLECHLKDENGKYVITNEYLDDVFGVADLNTGVVKSYNTNSQNPWFAILKPNIVNNLNDLTPLGISVYANAIDVLKGVDLAYDNLCTDFFLGGKMIMMNETVIAKEEGGRRIPPQFSRKRLFMSMGDSIIDGKMYEEYNPALRVDENTKGIYTQLSILASLCGLGEKFYSFSNNEVKTATEVISEDSALFRCVKKHEIIIENALLSLAKAVLGIFGINAEVLVSFDDSIIEDKKSQREQDFKDVQAGLMEKQDYIRKYHA